MHPVALAEVFCRFMDELGIGEMQYGVCNLSRNDKVFHHFAGAHHLQNRSNPKVQEDSAA
jgi:hypothetical protein